MTLIAISFLINCSTISVDTYKPEDIQSSSMNKNHVEATSEHKPDEINLCELNDLKEEKQDDTIYDEYTEDADFLVHAEIPDLDEDILCIQEKNKQFLNEIKTKFDYNNDDKLASTIHFLTSTQRNFTQQAIIRSAPYYNIIKEIFEEEGIPYHIGIGLVSIESAWKNRALSRARAAGLFQFIRSTGQRYGLRRTGHIEERYHITKAARASAQYLKNLYTIFRDWKLALAAYNAGEGRVFRAMVNTGYTNDWHSLESGNILARETRDYVAKILAAIIIWQNPEAYDLQSIDFYDNNIIELNVPKAFSPKGIANHMGIDLSIFKKFNPHLLNDNWIVPPSETTILIPRENKKRFASYFSDTSVYKRDQSRYAHHYNYDGEFLVITIQRGMTLSSIARRYNTTVNALMHINNLSSTRIVAGRTLRVPAPAHYGTSSQAQVLEEQDGFLIIKIQRGMTLYDLAKQYGTSVRELQRLNNLRSSRIVAGQSLRVPNPNT